MKLLPSLRARTGEEGDTGASAVLARHPAPAGLLGEICHLTAVSEAERHSERSRGSSERTSPPETSPTCTPSCHPPSAVLPHHGAWSSPSPAPVAQSHVAKPPCVKFPALLQPGHGAVQRRNSS